MHFFRESRTLCDVDIFFKLLFTGEKLNIVQRECIYVVELNFRSLNVKNNVSCCIVEIR